MEFVPLTSDQQRAFADDGFLVVPNALDRETIDRVLNEADTLAGPFLSKPVIADKPEYNHLVQTFICTRRPSFINVPKIPKRLRSAAAGIATSAWRAISVTKVSHSQASRSVIA
jgi:hypothetical protein